MIASANYVINEWLDADFDKYHPTKSLRPAVTGVLNGKIVIFEYIALAVAALGAKRISTGKALIIAVF